MQYPRLDVTPIKEIIFSISHNEIVESQCFEKFIVIDAIKKRFEENVPSFVKSIDISNKNIKLGTQKSGYRLQGNNEVIQLRTGSMSYHFLNGYCDYSQMLENILDFWKALNSVTKEKLNVNSVSVRYINDIEVDEDNPESRLIQVYPRQSSDREIKTFQNLVSFSYKNLPQYNVTAVSTKPNDKRLLLDITVTNAIQNPQLTPELLRDQFLPLQEVKNRVFYDSITAKALLRYLKTNQNDNT